MEKDEIKKILIQMFKDNEISITADVDYFYSKGNIITLKVNIGDDSFSTEGYVYVRPSTDNYL